MTGSKRSGGEHLFYPKQRYLPQGEGLLVLHAFYRGMKEPWEDLVLEINGALFPEERKGRLPATYRFPVMLPDPGPVDVQVLLPGGESPVLLDRFPVFVLPSSLAGLVPVRVRFAGGEAGKGAALLSDDTALCLAAAHALRDGCQALVLRGETKKDERAALRLHLPLVILSGTFPVLEQEERVRDPIFLAKGRGEAQILEALLAGRVLSPSDPLKRQLEDFVFLPFCQDLPDRVRGLFLELSLTSLNAGAPETAPMEGKLSHMLRAKRLDYLEMHLTDVCNLNCRGCSHFAPLVERDQGDNFRWIRRDVPRLREIVPNISLIRLLGGEPLLAEHFCEMVSLVRREYEMSRIQLVTNGILLPQVPEAYLSCLRENFVEVVISLYPGNEALLPGMEQRLKDHGVRYLVTRSRGEFTKRFDPAGSGDPPSAFLDCEGKKCHTLYDGRLYVCGAAAYIRFFNAYYGTAFDFSKESLDLYDPSLSFERVVTFLTTPKSFCAFCGEPVSFPWESRNGRKKIPATDWTVTGNGS